MEENALEPPLDDLVTPLKEAVDHWDGLGWERPQVAVVSGSGLAVDLGERIHGPVSLEYFLPFSCHPVEGHPHEVDVLLPREGRPVLYMRGRLHSYQGYDAYQTVFPIRFAALLGVKVLILTNATGGLQPEHRPGDLVLIKDQINLSGLNPLRGQLPPEWGPRFPDMSAAYDPALRELAHRLAGNLSIPLRDGVYAGVAGPSYETPAEVKMLRLLGGDVTGMSTVLEVIAAHHMGLRCLCLSMVSNAAAGMSDERIAHEDVLAAGAQAAGNIQKLLGALMSHPDLL
ncbi:MAG TPA: purine-nucleoside phosphorylase [Thermoanaerobaculia bacterium]|nr:purine-nucleoside phosphorylase [Thermoanaerobaculia bacterium]